MIGHSFRDPCLAYLHVRRRRTLGHKEKEEELGGGDGF